MSSQVVLVVTNLPANAGDALDPWVCRPAAPAPSSLSFRTFITQDVEHPVCPSGGPLMTAWPEGSRVPFSSWDPSHLILGPPLRTLTHHSG